MNKTLKQIFEEYRMELEKMQAIAECSPQRFTNPEYLNQFVKRADVLETLLSFYSRLLATQKKSKW